MKYKVGQKFIVEMREGFHLSKIVKKEIEVVEISEVTGLIFIKVPLKYGGYKKMFGYEKDLNSMIITNNDGNCPYWKLCVDND